MFYDFYKAGYLAMKKSGPYIFATHCISAGNIVSILTRINETRGAPSGAQGLISRATLK